MFANVLRFFTVVALALSVAASPAPADVTVDAASNYKCRNPTVRKEWRSLSTKEKTNWIAAVNCLANKPSSGKLQQTVFPKDIPAYNANGSWYDDFSFVHMDLNSHIHNTGLFLPWHRYYVWSYEQSLKTLCGYTGVSPYWNWALDAPNFSKATILSDKNAKSGLGTWGNPALDDTVQDGGFSSLHLSYPVSHTLRRKYTPYPFANLPPPLFTDPTVSAATTFTAKEVKKMVNGFEGDFKGFQSYFEDPEGAHTSVHLIMGGDLGGSCPTGSPSSCTPGPKWSPNEPMFWLHHAMVDKVWWDWQRACRDNFSAFEAGTKQDFVTWPMYPNGAPPAMHLDQPLPTNGILVGDYTVADMFDTTAGGPLCYVYDS